MAKIKEIYPRRPISRPHASVEVDSTGIGGSESQSEKPLMLIGKAEGGEPNTIYPVRNFSQAKQVFRSGELLDAIELAWGSNPSYTAGRIYAMRVEDAVPASTTQGGLKVVSDIYGNVSNNIQVALEKNTMSDSLRLHLIFENDKINETYDNIGNIFTIKYTGDNGTGSFSVEHNAETSQAERLVLKVNGEEVKAYDLTGGVYAYTNEIITDINQLPDFKAELSPFGDKNIESVLLDPAEDVDVSDKAEYVKAVFGDLQKQTAYNGLVHFERVFDDGTTSTEVTVDPDDTTASVTAKKATKGIEPFALTKLEGGSNGEPPTSWADKFEPFANLGAYYLVPLTDRETVHAEASHFVRERSDAGEPMRTIIGGGIAETKEKLYGRATSLSHPRVSLIANSGTFTMEDGRKLKAPAYLVASAIAGLASGLGVGESITFKNIRINELDIIYSSGDLDDLNENGIISIEFVRNRNVTNFRIVEDVTTYNDNSDPVKSEMSVGEANDFLVSELKVNLENEFIGTQTIYTSASLMKDYIISYLERKKRDNEIQDYTPEDVQVIIEGKEARISMVVYPIRSLKKISVSLVYKQQALQA